MKAKQSMSYKQFVEQYTTLRDDRSRPYSERDADCKALEQAHVKLYSAFMLRSGLGDLKEGSSVYLIVRKRSRESYQKTISVLNFVIRTDPGYHATPENPRLQPLTLTYHVARLMGYREFDCDGYSALRTDDYPQEFVAHLSQALFGFDKPGALECEVL